MTEVELTKSMTKSMTKSN